MFEKFYPDYYTDSVYSLNYRKLYAAGYRAALYDIDNTLVLHDLPAEPETARLASEIHEAGLKLVILSNNHEERVKRFADAVKADCYLYEAHKPNPHCFWQAAEMLKLDRKEMIFFGDQIFTDIWGARNAGVTSVLVHPVGPEKYWYIKVKRFFEKPILAEYRHREFRKLNDHYPESVG